MRKIFIIVFMWLLCLGAAAQNISVKSFKALPMDMTASSLEGKRLDQNGDVAALIKVMTTETGFVFEGGTLGIVDTQQRVGEIWVWVPRSSRKITILHQQLGGLRDYRYPIDIEAERTYEMVLTTAKIETIVKEEVRMQYLAFQITPPNAMLMVNEEMWEVGADGTAMKFVDFGAYTYRVQAPNYHPDAGRVVVDNPTQAHRVTVNLQPDFVQVTLKVDADAEIWVNDEKKGTRSWTGPLGKGSYKIECKQAAHETTLTTQKITAEMDGQTITLTAPRPVYGSLNVESTPFATLFIDGKAAGETPCFVPEILIGQHEIKLAKDGYTDHVETVTITKGERKQVKATLSNGKEIQFTCNVPDAQLEIDGQRVGSAMGTYHLTFGNHSLKATAIDYSDYTGTINVSKSGNRSYSVQMQKIAKEIASSKENVTAKNETVTIENAVSRFFPVFGMTLGKTTWKDVKQRGYKVERKYGLSYPDRMSKVEEVEFWDHEGIGVFTSLVWTHYDGDFPEAWKQFGFSWDNSYDEWLAVFNRLGYDVMVKKEPHTRVYDGRNTLSADVDVISSDETLEFSFSFEFGNNKDEGYETSSPRSLYSITIKYKRGAALKNASAIATANANDAVSQFFPLFGIMLGKSTWNDVKNLGYNVERFDTRQPDRVANVEGVSFWDHKGTGIFTELYWTQNCEANFSKSWRQLGFSWDNSYDEWLALFNRLGYEVIIKKGPHTKEYNGRNTLSADVDFMSSDGTLEFSFDFDYGNDNNEGYETSSPRSLYSITIRYKK